MGRAEHNRQLKNILSIRIFETRIAEQNFAMAKSYEQDCRNRETASNETYLRSYRDWEEKLSGPTMNIDSVSLCSGHLSRNTEILENDRRRRLAAQSRTEDTATALKKNHFLQHEANRIAAKFLRNTMKLSDERSLEQFMAGYLFDRRQNES